MRIFNPVNDTDQIVLILKGIHEINNASLSPDRKAIGKLLNLYIHVFF